MKEPFEPFAFDISPQLTAGGAGKDAWWALSKWCASASWVQ